LVSFGSGLLDYYNSYKSKKEADQITQDMLNQSRAAAQYAMQDAAYNDALRASILGTNADMATTLMNVFNAIGPREAIDPASVNADYERLRERKFDDVNRAIDRVNSQG